MNRIIKFRAWNGETMISPDYIDRTGVAWWKENSIPECTGLIMQFTGLHDKDGNEIYEGDIIKSGSSSIGDVQFSHGVFGVEWLHAKLNKSMLGGWGQLHNLRTMDDDHMAENMTVIGNVFENPELMNNESTNPL